MTKMEQLNAFFVERLMTAAGEIFEAVRDTVFEYQEELERTQQENCRLREILSEISFSSSGVIQTEDVQPSHADEQGPLEQDSDQTDQRPLSSDPSMLQLKLKLAAIKQEAEPQPALKDASTSVSPCAKSDPDTWTSHADGVLLEQQNTSQGPQDPEPSVTQVKRKLATLQEENETPEHSYDTVDMEEQEEEEDCLHENTFTIKSEPADPQVPHSSTTQSGHHLDLKESEPGMCVSPLYNQICDDLSDAAAQPQSHSPTNSFRCVECNELLASPWLLKKHMLMCHKERPYICHMCGKNYSDLYVLRVHLKTHSIERPFQCDACGKMYKKKSHLKDHERTHTGDKRYSCSACGMCFIWTNQVKVHIQNHHRGQMATVVKKPIT